MYYTFLIINEKSFFIKESEVPSLQVQINLD